MAATPAAMLLLLISLKAVRSLETQTDFFRRQKKAPVRMSPDWGLHVRREPVTPFLHDGR
jgi:hypothetical protein